MSTHTVKTIAKVLFRHGYTSEVLHTEYFRRFCYADLRRIQSKLDGLNEARRIKELRR